MSAKTKIIHTSARRKTSSARVSLMEGKGRIRVNEVPLEVFDPVLARGKILEPLLLTGDLRKQLDISIETRGGGIVGQAEAARKAIALALLNWSKSKALRETMIAYDRSIIAGDGRQKEPKKFGGPGARVRRQKSYR